MLNRTRVLFVAIFMAARAHPCPAQVHYRKSSPEMLTAASDVVVGMLEALVQYMLSLR